MVNQEEFDNFVYIQALENAIGFNGKANPKALIGKVVPKFPNMKNNMAKYSQDIENIVQQVNNMSLEEQKEKIVEFNPDFFKMQEKKAKEKKEESSKEKKLPKLEDSDKSIRTRFCPAPSGHLHLGHLYGIVFNYEYVKEYGGEFIVRVEDTNPENVDINNYDNILEDIKWITEDGIDELYYQSDRIETYYKYLRTLIETGKAYVCECDVEVFKTYNDSSQPCPHRDMDPIKQEEMFSGFFNNKYEDGDAIIRFKADLENKNPALRDFPLARLKSQSHPRVGNKYRLWPMYNLCTSIDDSLMKVTHIIRGKDHEINGLRQDMIKKALGFKNQFYFHYGRMKFIDIELSKTILSEKINNKIYTGWDDPRVPTLKSYRKRGYKAKAFRNLIISQGMSKRDSKISDEEYHKSLDYFNRQILEVEANRLFFVSYPKKLKIVNSDDYPDVEVELLRHPDFKDRGYRKFELTNEYFIDKVDFNNIEKGDIIRLMHFGNFEIIDKTEDTISVKFISKEYDKDMKLKRNIHYVSSKDFENVEIVMQDSTVLKGICEINENPKPESSFQFERFGFVKYDHKREDDTKVYYFTHR